MNGSTHRVVSHTFALNPLTSGQGLHRTFFGGLKPISSISRSSTLFDNDLLLDPSNSGIPFRRWYPVHPTKLNLGLDQLIPDLLCHLLRIRKLPPFSLVLTTRGVDSPEPKEPPVPDSSQPSRNPALSNCIHSLRIPLDQDRFAGTECYLGEGKVLGIGWRDRSMMSRPGRVRGCGNWQGKREKCGRGCRRGTNRVAGLGRRGRRCRSIFQTDGSGGTRRVEVGEIKRRNISETPRSRCSRAYRPPHPNIIIPLGQPLIIIHPRRDARLLPTPLTSFDMLVQ